jgi:hypothetical protein
MTAPSTVTIIGLAAAALTYGRLQKVTSLSQQERERERER